MLRQEFAVERASRQKPSHYELHSASTAPTSVSLSSVMIAVLANDFLAQ